MPRSILIGLLLLVCHTANAQQSQEPSFQLLLADCPHVERAELKSRVALELGPSTEVNLVTVRCTATETQLVLHWSDGSSRSRRFQGAHRRPSMRVLALALGQLANLPAASRKAGRLRSPPAEAIWWGGVAPELIVSGVEGGVVRYGARLFGARRLRGPLHLRVALTAGGGSRRFSAADISALAVGGHVGLGAVFSFAQDWFALAQLRFGVLAERYRATPRDPQRNGNSAWLAVYEPGAEVGVGYTRGIFRIGLNIGVALATGYAESSLEAQRFAAGPIRLGLALTVAVAK